MALGNNVISTSGVGNSTGISGVVRSVSGANTIASNWNLIGGGGDTTVRADANSTLNINGNVGAFNIGLRNLNLVGDGDFNFGGLLRDSNSGNATDRLGVNSGTTGTTTFNIA